MGRRKRRTRPGLRRAVALLADARRRPYRPDREAGRGHQDQSQFAPPYRFGVEPGRGRRDGASALPLPVPVLRGRRQAFLPALPAFGGYFPGRTLQHRLLRAPDLDGRAGDRAASPAISSTRSATRISTRTISIRRACNWRVRRSRCRRMRINPAVRDIFSFRYEDFELVGYEADASIKAPIAV